MLVKEVFDIYNDNHMIYIQNAELLIVKGDGIYSLYIVPPEL
jgi:hypothetical protein